MAFFKPQTNQDDGTTKKLYVCSHCGEPLTKKAVYCPQCSTQAGRKKIFDENMAIIAERQRLGLQFPDTLPNYR